MTPIFKFETTDPQLAQRILDLLSSTSINTAAPAAPAPASPRPSAVATTPAAPAAPAAPPAPPAPPAVPPAPPAPPAVPPAPPAVPPAPPAPPAPAGIKFQAVQDAMGKALTERVPYEAVASVHQQCGVASAQDIPENFWQWAVDQYNALPRG